MHISIKKKLYKFRERETKKKIIVFFTRVKFAYGPSKSKKLVASLLLVYIFYYYLKDNFSADTAVYEIVDRVILNFKKAYFWK